MGKRHTEEFKSPLPTKTKTKDIMNKRQFKANENHLTENGVYVKMNQLWKEYPYSRELFLCTNSGGDFSICVEELTREKVLDVLSDFDVNEETMKWWGGRGVPFDNIKDLYNDIEQWKEDFIQIAVNMPY